MRFSRVFFNTEPKSLIEATCVPRPCMENYVGLDPVSIIIQPITIPTIIQPTNHSTIQPTTTKGPDRGKSIAIIIVCWSWPLNASWNHTIIIRQREKPRKRGRYHLNGLVFWGRPMSYVAISMLHIAPTAARVHFYGSSSLSASNVSTLIAFAGTRVKVW